MLGIYNGYIILDNAFYLQLPNKILFKIGEGKSELSCKRKINRLGLIDTDSFNNFIANRYVLLYVLQEYHRGYWKSIMLMSASDFPHDRYSEYINNGYNPDQLRLKHIRLSYADYDQRLAVNRG